MTKRAVHLIALSGLLVLSAWGGMIIVPPGDPQVADLAPSEPGGGGPPESHIGTLTFTFTSLLGTSPSQSACVIAGVNDDVCDFVNVSGQTWNTLTFVVSPGAPLTSCAAFNSDLSSCAPVQQGDSTTPSILFFSGGQGLVNGEAFGIAIVGWSDNTSVLVCANGSCSGPPTGVAPEPQSWLLLVVGVGGFYLLRGARRFHFSQANR